MMTDVSASPTASVGLVVRADVVIKAVLVVWPVPPLADLPVYIRACRVRGAPLYDFVDPAADFGTWVVILLAVFSAVQWAVWALRVLSRRRVGTDS